MLLISCSLRIVLEFSSALYLCSSSAWLSILIFYIVNPHEKGLPNVKKSSSYLIWIFFISNLTPLKSLVNSPIIGGTLNSPYFFASAFFFYSAAYAAGFLYLLRSSAYRFAWSSALILARLYLLLSFSSFFSRLLAFTSGFLSSSTSSCIMTILVI